MLKEIHIENYKSLKNVTVQFKEGLNIIIGKNGSGKSNLLDFIDGYANLKPLMVLDVLRRFPSDYSYTFLYDVDQRKYAIIFAVKSNNAIESGGHLGSNKHISVVWKDALTNVILDDKVVFATDNMDWGVLNSLIHALSSIRNFEVNLLPFNIPSSLYWLDKPNSVQISEVGHQRFMLERELDEFYLTVSFCLFFEDQINRSVSRIEHDRIDWVKAILFETFEQFNEEVGLDSSLGLFSPIEKIRISPYANLYVVDGKILIENLVLEFKINGKWMPWGHLSDGTKRLFYLISEICCQRSGLVLIEEPELGIHPHQLYKLMQFIKEQSQYKQIIISTHSPLVLDSLEADELDRIIIAKAENGSSQFSKLSDEQIEKAKVYMHEEMDISFYWLHSDLEGE